MVRSRNDSDLRNKLGLSALNRRSFLMLSAASVGAMLLHPPVTQAQDHKVKTTARIVIAGGGAAGLTAASQLSAQLDGAKITIVDARQEHLYQPGFTLIAAGIKPMAYAISATAEYLPPGIEWVQEQVVEFDPEGRRIVTNKGQSIPYDFLVVATGLKLDYDAITGMDVARIGQNGLGSVYHSPAGAEATWKALSAFADRGGVGVFSRPATEMKCSGAPLKYTFISDDHLRRRGNRSKAEFIYNAHNNTLFSVPIVHEKVRMLFEDRGIRIQYDHILESIDVDRRIATFKTLDGSEELPYDFINVIPPMRAPDAVRNSPLRWQDGPFASDGWLDVDKGTLRHKRYANVFGIGDVAGVPKGKTAASVKWQAPVAVDHLVATITDAPSDAIYKGYTSCPLITRLGRAMLVEFDYQNNLTPSFPGVIAPLEELWVTWVIKTMALKPTYLAMLRGYA